MYSNLAQTNVRQGGKSSPSALEGAHACGIMHPELCQCNSCGRQSLSIVVVISDMLLCCSKASFVNVYRGRSRLANATNQKEDHYDLYVRCSNFAQRNGVKFYQCAAPHPSSLNFSPVFPKQKFGGTGTCHFVGNYRRQVPTGKRGRTPAPRSASY